MSDRRNTHVENIEVSGRRFTDVIPPSEQDYSKREVDEKFTDIKGALMRIETQTSKTNGRVTRLEKLVLIVGVTVVVVGILKFPEITKEITSFL